MTKLKFIDCSKQKQSIHPGDKIIKVMAYSEYDRILSASARLLCNPHTHQVVSLEGSSRGLKVFRNLNDLQLLPWLRAELN